MAISDSKATSTHTVRTGPGTVQVDPSSGSDSNSSIMLQADGKILVGGYSFHTAFGYPGSPGDDSYGARGDHTVYRLNADGSLDTSFNQSGIAILPDNLNSEDANYVMAVQSDGKVLSAHSGRDGVVIERFNLDGTLDASFATMALSALFLTTPTTASPFPLMRMAHYM